MVEDSSEIASAGVLKSYRKSMKRTFFKNKTEPTRNHSLSKISEENTDESSESEELRLKRQVNCCNVTFVSDDVKVTCDTANTANSQSSEKEKVSHEKEIIRKEPVTDISDKVICGKSNKEDKEESDKFQLMSRFVPEFIDNNKIIIV